MFCPIKIWILTRSHLIFNELFFEHLPSNFDMDLTFDLFLPVVSSMASFRTFEIMQSLIMIQFASDHSWLSLLCCTAYYNNFRCWLTCSRCRFCIFDSTNSTPHWLEPMSQIWWSHSLLKKSSLSSKFYYWLLSAVILLIWLAKKNLLSFLCSDPR